MLKLKNNNGLIVPEYDTIPVPSPTLNAALGGGLKTRSVTCFWGPPQAGKSTFSQITMGMAQEQGYASLIVENEPGAYTNRWMEHCGLKPEMTEVFSSCMAEEIAGYLIPYLKEKEKVIILIDSISGVVLEQAFKKDDGSLGIAPNARGQIYLWTKLTNYMHEHMHIIALAQQSVSFANQQAFLRPNIGNRTEHVFSNMIKLFPNKAADDKEVMERDDDTSRILGQKVTWTLDKTREGGEGTKGFFWYDKVNGLIDVRRELFAVAVGMGIITKGGAWYTYGDIKAQGRAKFFDVMGPKQWLEVEEAIGDMTGFVYEDDEDE